MPPRPAHTYRAARRNEAKRRHLLWHTIPNQLHRLYGLVKWPFVVAALAAASTPTHADDVRNCPLIATVTLSVASGPIAVPFTILQEAWQCGTAQFDPTATLTVDQPSLVVATLTPARMVMLAPGPAAGLSTVSTSRSGVGYGNTVVRYATPSGELGQLNVTVLP